AASQGAREERARTHPARALESALVLGQSARADPRLLREIRRADPHASARNEISEGLRAAARRRWGGGGGEGAAGGQGGGGAREGPGASAAGAGARGRVSGGRWRLSVA